MGAKAEFFMAIGTFSSIMALAATASTRKWPLFAAIILLRAAYIGLIYNIVNHRSNCFLNSWTFFLYTIASHCNGCIGLFFCVGFEATAFFFRAT